MATDRKDKKHIKIQCSLCKITQPFFNRVFNDIRMNSFTIQEQEYWQKLMSSAMLPKD